jgi:hypothetical protein
VTSLDSVLTKLDGARRSGEGWSARCPAHEDRSPSLTVAAGKDGRILLHCQAGCSIDAICSALGVDLADLFPPRQKTSRASTVATYDYTDADGGLLFQVVRYDNKTFKQRRPDGAGGWSWNLGSVKRVLYRLPEVVEAVAAGKTIFVPEGEKDVDALRAAGEIATCNPMGAGKWRAEHARVLHGAEEVVVVADTDLAGTEHAHTVAESLAGKVGHLLVAHAAIGKDAADHLGAGRTVDELVTVYDSDQPATAEIPIGISGGTELGPRLSHQLASQVKVVPPDWRWRCWLVAGAVQLLVGRQGAGKSSFAAWVVAQLSTGRPWPDDVEPRPALRCGMLSLEEPAGRLAARLVAAGADLNTVEILGHVEDHDDDGRPYPRPWRLPGDCAALEAAIAELDLAVVTIDGLGYSVAGDSHNYANVGAALSALAGVAERTDCTIVGLTHPPKGSADAVTAAIGSTAWTAIARITWVMGLDPTDELPDTHPDKRRAVRPAPGSNYRLPDHGLSFAIAEHDETEAGFVTNLNTSDVDAQLITSPPVPASEEQRTALEEAVDFLGAYLAGGIEHKAADVVKAAQLERISDSTLARARPKAGVRIRRDGFGKGSVVWWHIDATAAIDPNKSHTSQRSDAGIYDESWDLWAGEAPTRAPQ